MNSSGVAGAVGLLERAVESRFLPGYAAAVYRNGAPVFAGARGTLKPGEPGPSAEEDSLFLIASLTKPIVCAGALLLLAEGAFALHQPVRSFIPEFRDGLKDQVTLLHLFTHTSGLYDQLPRSRELRTGKAPIAEFVRAVCETDLLFAPGTAVSYQSMGVLLIGEIVERITGMQLRDYLQERLFAPLQMTSTVLGLPADGMARVAHSLDAPFAPDSNDVGNDWNTPYWRDFGAPWGGLHSTVNDLSRFLSHMLGDAGGPLPPSLRGAMRRDWTATMPLIPAAEKLTSRWGLGWSLGNEAFGSLVSPMTFGHRGATGTMFWADPETHLSCVLLTNQPRLWRDAPAELSELPARFSNAVAASLR